MSVQATATDVSAQVEQLLRKMTLAEKVGQMTQIDFTVIGSPDDEGLGGHIDPVKLEDALLHHHVGSILNTPFTPNNRAQPIETWRAMQATIKATAAKSRLKIPVLYGIDAIHGATYTQNSTLFPQAISMAATFNPDLSFKAGEITAREIRASGLQWNFSPVMDIGRQPLWPRLWETYGEDVHLATAMGTAFIKGHQGNNFAAPDKGLTCLKHYVGYSFPFTGKDRTPAYMSERMLREIFLPSFAAGIKAGSPTIMVNSAEVDGIPGHANSRYLNDILRGELGFTGFTVSDWEDIKRLFTRDRVAASEQEAVKIAVMAGVDMSMVPFDFSFYDILIELVNNGQVPMSRIDEAVSRILRVKFQAGLFAAQPEPISVTGNFATPAATATNLQAAHEAIILAKNQQQILPLKKDAKILVTGPTANSLNVMNGGWTITWQGDNEALYPKDKLSLLAALQARNPNVEYVGGDNFDAPIDLEAVKAAAENSDYIILSLGEKPYTETKGNIPSLVLDKNQHALADAVFATGKPVILITFGGRPRIVTGIAEKANAVLLGFLPGMEGGVAMADILFGDYNPDGKLPITYPRATNDIVLYDHKAMEAFEDNFYQPLYPFGHGLSYSSFKTEHLKVDKSSISAHDQVKVSVDVTNTGSRAGKETVLLYLQDVVATVSRPNKQLKAFEKVLLAPGETKQLSFTLSHDDLAFIGADLKARVEPGEFVVMIGQESVKFSVQ